MYSILLLEDDLLFASSIEDFLVCEGFCVDIAKDGEEGFELYKKEKPDLILSDIRMPVCDGIEMTKKSNNWIQQQK